MNVISAIKSLEFDEGKHVMTRRGPRVVRQASPTDEFWRAWRQDKDKMKDMGYSVSKVGDKWVVEHWAEPVISREAVQASRAKDSDMHIPLPEGVTLYPYQRAGVAYAVLHGGRVLIADEMGLGKTAQAIAAANCLKPNSVLVICPASLRENWRREWQRFATLPMPIHVGKRDIPQGSACWIVSYEDAMAIDWSEHSYEMVIIDEAHYIKNRKAQRSEVVRALCQRAQYVLLLTGTPVLNRPAELWHLLHCLDPKTWKNFHAFGLRYCGAQETRWGWDYSGASNLRELQDILRSRYMVRRAKDEVLGELPPKVRSYILLQADAEVREALEALRKAYDEAGGDLDQLRLQAARVEFAEIARARADIGAWKARMIAPRIVEMIAEQEVSKLVVFAHHHEAVEVIRDALEKAGIAHAVITGETAPEVRQAEVDRFQDAPACKVFVGTIKAAGVGLTLTAASTVVMVEQDWTPANMQQAEDRCHRIGQRDSVHVINVVVDGTVDARIAELLRQKMEVIEKVAA